MSASVECVCRIKWWLVLVTSIAAIGVSVAVIGSAGGSPQLTSSPRAPMVFSAPTSKGTEIFVSGDGRSKPVQITRNAIEDDSPAFSPSGERIAWARGTDRRNEIVTARLDGSNLERLQGSGEGLGDLAWSPDGRWIACVAWRGGSWRITLVSARGSAPRNLTTGLSPQWVDPGSRLVFADLSFQGARVFGINADGSGRKALTPLVGRSFSRIDWLDLSVSPDGSRIAFSIGGARDSSEIYVVGMDGSGFRKLPPHGADPAWSPKGDRFAFVRDRGSILVADRDGRQIRTLIPAPWGAIRNPQWSATGEEIAFEYMPGRRGGIGSASLANPHPHMVFQTGLTSLDSFRWFH